MTPKKKAKELVDFYLKLLSDVSPLNSYAKAAKTASQKCVDEILKNTLIIPQVLNYWQEVKKEILKL